ncbi:A-kinase anchor protein 6 [Myotis brandtii]|uniref:A-kinase anchor protein 6 n=1 Tax=Myotis brandtii TaxID=109478 RepID=S7Q121_MYOBR|nr:A-kinase anchor protein 6 [Myotis brandtii]
MLTMSVTLSPLRSQDLDPMATDASPMAINLTPTVEQGEGEEVVKDMDSDQQYEKPPPLHTGADWKIVLHLPEIETWLRMTSERVRDLTHSVQQDSDSKHVDVHLVQLKGERKEAQLRESKQSWLRFLRLVQGIRDPAATGKSVQERKGGAEEKEKTKKPECQADWALTGS